MKRKNIFSPTGSHVRNLGSLSEEGGTFAVIT